MSEEKQIEEMAEAICYACRPHTPYCEHIMCEGAIESAKAVYNAGYRKQSEWIPVSERLPEDSSDVIAVVSGRERNIKYINATMLANYFSATNEWALSHNPEVVVSVTHWMPLPEVPKEDKL